MIDNILCVYTSLCKAEVKGYIDKFNTLYISPDVYASIRGSSLFDNFFELNFSIDTVDKVPLYFKNGATKIPVIITVACGTFFFDVNEVDKNE